MAASSLVPKEISDYFDIQLTPKITKTKKEKSVGSDKSKK
jgi:hypothetical protein